MQPSNKLDYFADLDVLHLMFWYEKRTSISKIVDNLMTNARQVRQAVVSFPDFQLDLAPILNETQPKIIHLHYGGEHPQSEFLKRLSYKPRIVHTVHTPAPVPSIFADIADRIVCIDEFRLRINPGAKSVWIENSVDVSGIPRHTPNQNGICNALRFSADQMQPALLDLFARLDTKSYFYGADEFLAFSSEHNNYLCEYAKQFPNIECLPYCHDLERRMIGHSFFTYYVQNNNNPLWCHGLNVMEAVSLGLPVVTLKRGQLGQQYIVHGHNGYFANNDEEFLGYCTQILENAGLYLELCANASRHADGVTNSMPQKYQEMYLSIL
jgi:glycosyltransferase involved in cell wall biosynthesis